MIVTTNIFQGELTIGQLDHTDVAAEVTLFIEKHEPLFLTMLLGGKLYKELVDGLSQPIPEQKWEDLADMVGLMTASYIYYWYQRDHVTTSAGTGEVAMQAENANRSPAVEKMVRAWNEMVRLACMFRCGIDKDIYTSYTSYRYAEIYRPINSFGI